MLQSRLRRLEAIFHAVSSVPPERRTEEMDRLCGQDSALRAELHSLMEHEVPPARFLEQPALGPAFSMSVPTQPDDLVGREVGPYRIEHRLASGGMGTVYVASRADGQFEQTVAIKVVKRGMDSEEILRRFHQERRTLAALSHPNIARLLDGGALGDGRPYVVMEFVSGVPIDNYCDAHRLTITERLRLFCRVCEGIRFAHQNLVVHRDLKPGNVLVSADGEPKLLDFGISKVLGGTGSREITTVQDRRYTPEYASPEQTAGQPLTTATDIYSLGVILYELLTGHRPYQFQTRTGIEIERVVRETAPATPSIIVRSVETSRGMDRVTEDPITPESVSRVREGTPDRLLRRLRGDLDTIVLKAMHKEPGRRYPSVEQLVADIERHLDGMPVLARPDTVTYRAQKFIRRHTLAVGAASVALLLLALGFGSALWQARVARRERDAAYLARDQAEATADFLQNMLAAADPVNLGPDRSIRSVLDSVAIRADSDLKSQPLVQAAVQSTIGRTYLGLGLLEQAETNINAAQATRKVLLESGHHDLAESEFDLAHLYYAQGRFAEAETLLIDCLATHRRLRGAENLDTARVLNDLGAVQRAAGKTDAAASTLREALVIREKLASRESLEFAESLNNLAGVLRAQGNSKGAEELMTEVLQTRRRLLREEHPLVLQSMANLAVVASANGDLDRGERLLREVVRLDRKVFGDQHPSLAVDLSGLGRVLMLQKRYADAEPLLRESLEIRRGRLAADDDRRLKTQVSLAECLIAQGRDAEAEPLLAVAIQLAPAGAIASDIVWSKAAEALIRVYDRAGESAKAKQIAALQANPTSRRAP